MRCQMFHHVFELGVDRPIVTFWSRPMESVTLACAQATTIDATMKIYNQRIMLLLNVNAGIT